MANRPSVTPRPSSPITVFIVDDDPSARKGLLWLVRFAGWEGEAFASAREFLARPAFSGTGCVILDVRMPGMTGTQLRGLMAARNISLPVVFLTGHGDVPMSVDAMKKGAVDFLQKPVNDEALLQAIHRALERHAAAQLHHQEVERIQARVLPDPLAVSLKRQFPGSRQGLPRPTRRYRCPVPGHLSPRQF